MRVENDVLYDVQESDIKDGTFIIPDNVKVIGQDAFLKQLSLTHIVIPDTVEKIEAGAFMNCINLEQITLSNELKSIGIGAFAFCSKLEEINFPESLESIDISAFCNTGLNAAELPSNLKHLENERKNLIECAIKGFIVGDVIGIPYEGKKRNSFICNGIRRSWIKDSHFILPIGTWSDDTSLMLCVLDCLAENPKSIARLWRKRAFYFILGGYTNHFFKIPYDIGKATMIGIIKLRLGIKNKNACKEKANGNGGLMRIPPLSLMGLKNEELVNYVKVFNSCSHNTDLSNQCCIFYILYVKQVAIYEKIDAYKKAICLFRCLFLNPETQMNRILSGKIQDIQESEIVSSGYVIHTLEAVLWAFLNTKDYNNALLKAINLGGDTDTIGALTGWIAGVYYKTYNLEWYKKVKRKKFVEKKIEKIKNNIDKQHLNNYG